MEWLGTMNAVQVDRPWGPVRPAGAPDDRVLILTEVVTFGLLLATFAVTGAARPGIFAAVALHDSPENLKTGTAF